MLGKFQRNSFIIIIFLFLGTVVLSQESNPPADTLFSEIILEDGAVVAVDTFGNEWYYDFSTDQFVIGVLPDTTAQDTDVNSGVMDLPIEERCIVKKKIKNFSKKALVDFDEVVEGDILVRERVNIKGWVKGDVTSLNNRVLIYPSGRVDGDVYASEIIIHDGGILNGSKLDAPLNLPDIPTEISEVGVAVIFIIMIALFVFIFLIVALMPRKLDVFMDCYNNYSTRNFFLGFLVFLLMSPFMVLLVITIVGIFFIPLVPLLYAIAILMGITVFSNNIGKIFSKKILGSEKSLYFQTFVGYSIFSIFWILAISLMTASEGSTAQGFGIFFLVVSILLSIIPVFSGIGVAFLTRFGFKPYVSWKDKQGGKTPSPAPAPPPIPTVPHVQPPTSHPKSPYDRDDK